MARIKVLVVDDHPLIRGAVVDVIATQETFAVTGQASDGLEAIELAKRTQPDLILMDLSMPNMGGIEATRHLQSEVPAANVIILTASAHLNDLYAAMEAGARGFLLKNRKANELIQALLDVSRGKIVIDPEMQASQPESEGDAEARRLAKGAFQNHPSRRNPGIPRYRYTTLDESVPPGDTKPIIEQAGSDPGRVRGIFKPGAAGLLLCHTKTK